MGEKSYEKDPGRPENKPPKALPSEKILRGIGKTALGGANKPK